MHEPHGSPPRWVCGGHYRGQTIGVSMDWIPPIGECIMQQSALLHHPECATLKDANSAGRVITVLLLVT